MFSSQFVIPEPSSIVLMLAAISVGIVVRARRRGKAVARSEIRSR
jgi:hypothetical protein